MKYTNPIIKGFYPDPSICKFNGKYYLVTSSFEYFPGIPIFSSKDLVNWTQIGHCLTRKSQLDLTDSEISTGVFAPTIRENKGRLYVIATNVTIAKNFYVYTDNPEEGWSEPIFINGWEGIDPSLFFDDDGRVYIQGNAYKSEMKLGIYQAEINIDTGELISNRIYICPGTGGKAPEAPHVFKRNGYYYLVLAEGGTEYGHMVTIFRSKSILGPFEGYSENPIMTHRSIQNPIQCVGHADIFEDFEGNWWAVCLGIRVKGSHAYYHHLGRETYLTPVQWNSEEWPSIENKNIKSQIFLEMDGPLVAEQIEKKGDLIQDFKTLNSLSQRLVFLRSPAEDCYRLLSGEGLQMIGRADLSTRANVTFLGLRQTDFSIRFEVEFSKISKFDGSFGITAFMSRDFHYKISVEPSSNRINFEKKIGTISYIESSLNLSEIDNLCLVITSDDSFYYFGVQNNNEYLELGKAECKLIASEVSATFTGAMLGIFAESKENNQVIISNLRYLEE